MLKRKKWIRRKKKTRKINGIVRKIMRKAR